MFYSVYSFPNIVLPILGGYLVDMIGVRTGNFFFTLLVLIGQGVFAFGVMIKSYPIALLGRGIFGLGGESLMYHKIIRLWDGLQEKSFLCL